MPIFDKQVINAKAQAKPYKLYDGDGLYLQVQAARGGVSKYWRYRYEFAGRERTFQIGTYPEIGLSEARKRADEARKVVREGKDPVIERKLARARNTAATLDDFATVAAEWTSRNRGRWSPSYLAKIESAMAKTVLPRLGSLPISRIDAKLVRGVVEPVESRGAFEAARKLRKWISEVFGHAISTGRLALNPCDHVKVATRPSIGHPHLRRADLGEFMRALSEYQGRPETRIAVQLLLLTFVRPGELRAAQWSEFNLEEADWRIPAERMKTGGEHIVPLSRQAVALLRELQEITGHSRYLFPGGRGRVPFISENTINKAIAMLGYKGRLVGHGFRATASTILNESGRFNADAIERQLAHAPRDKIRAAYHRAEYLPERRKMMQWYADLLAGLQRGGEVKSIRKA